MIIITQKYLPTPSLRSSGQKILGVKFIVAHDTGNDGSTALQNVDYYIKSADEMEASAHAFVDDKGVIECIDLGLKAWHVRRNPPQDNQLFGVDANDYSIGVELCYFSNDIQRSKLAYNNYVEYIKTLCTKYQLDPTKHVVGHYTLDPSRRTDPVNAFRYIGKTWVDFIKDLVPPIEPDYKQKIRKIISELQTLL